MVRVDPLTGEVEDVPARHITGMDGKEYAFPTQRKQKIKSVGTRPTFGRPISARIRYGILDRKSVPPSPSEFMQVTRDIKAGVTNVTPAEPIPNGQERSATPRANAQDRVDSAISVPELDEATFS